MDFDEITTIIPWERMALDCGQDLNAEHAWEPRLFKSHFNAGEIPKGARYIHVIRDPADAFISQYKFMLPYFGVSCDLVDIEVFMQDLLERPGNWCHYYLSWWERQGPDVLWVAYEDLKKDSRSQIRRIASFMGIDASEELLDLVEKQSSFSFMSAANSKFDDHFVFSMTRDRCLFPKEYVFGDLEVSKVRAAGGTTGGGKVLSEAATQRLAEEWRRVVEPQTGFRNYEEMRAAMT
jgi:aryl sulfotransferase